MVPEIFVLIVGDDGNLFGLVIGNPIATARFFSQPNQLGGIRDRQRFQQNGVRQSENGGGCSNSECERQDRRDRERGSHPQPAQCVARVEYQRFHKRQSSLIPIVFLRCFHQI